MSGNDKQNVDEYKSIAILGNRHYDGGGLPSGSLTLHPVIAGSAQKLDIWYRYWEPKVVKAFIRNLGTRRCTEMPPDSIFYIDPIHHDKANGNKYFKTPEEMEAELLKILKDENLYQLFIDKVIMPAIREMQEITYRQPAQLASAMMDKRVLEAFPEAYARFSITGQERSTPTLTFSTWPYREFLVQSGGSFYSDAYIKGLQGSGKSTLAKQIIKLGIAYRNWTYTTLPVNRDDFLHVYHISKLSDLFTQRVAPSIFEFMVWRDDIRRTEDNFSASITLVADEMGKSTAESNRTGTIASRLSSALQQYARKFSIARVELGADKEDPELENKKTCVMTTYKDGVQHYMKVQRYDGTEKIEEKVLTEAASDLPFSFYETERDVTVPLEIDIDFMQMITDVAETAGIEFQMIPDKDLIFLCKDWCEAALSKGNTRMVGVSVCPACGSRKPYNSQKNSAFECRDKDCRTQFEVDPIAGLNFLEMSEVDYGQFQRSRKREWVGVSVCPYCGEMDTYNSPKRTTKMCSKHKKPFDVYPGDAIHWQEITAEWVEQEAVKLREQEQREALEKKAEAEHKQKTEELTELDKLIIEKWPTIKDKGRAGISWFCKSTRVNRRKPNRRTVQYHIDILKAGEYISYDPPSPDIVEKQESLSQKEKEPEINAKSEKGA